jgi:hypothetical protein
VDQIVSQPGESLLSHLGPALLDDDGLTIDIAQFAESVTERLEVLSVADRASPP